MTPPNEGRPGATNTGAAATSKGAEVTSMLPRRRNWREVFAPPTPVELLVIFAGGWIAALWSAVTK